nr:GerMN domain-containing protein [Acidobacteriota bacterium]
AQAIAEGTKVRQMFVTEDGTAFVDLSKQAVANHRGGSLDELFAVYAIVNAVTVNLPAIKAVQIMVDGQEVDTLAGHVDLRHPLPRNLSWVGTPDAATDGGTPGAPPAPAGPPPPAPTPPRP